MPKRSTSGTPENFQQTLSHRLRWALDSTLQHFLRRPDHNAIEDWADSTALEVDEDLDAFTRIPTHQEAPQDSPLDA